jgi:PAS domain S-box-containing protein
VTREDDRRVGGVACPDLLAAVGEAADGVVWVFDAEKTHFVSDGCESVLGRTAEDVRTDPSAVADGLHPDDRETFREWQRDALDGAGEAVTVRVDADGDDRRLRIQAQSAGEEQATPVVAVGRDVTERKRREAELETLEEELAESQEELQRFAYVASHDLQEPLRMVRSYMNLLESEYTDELDEEAEEYIDFAVDGAARMKALVEGLLEFSRVETRGGDIEPVDAEAVAEEAKRGLAMRVEETDATVEIGDLPTVPADRSQLSQVFQNLLDNALQYAGDDPPDVAVRCEEQAEAFVFAVDDEGAGVPADRQERMFELFERGADATGEGTGVGLAITRRIVQRHDGEMWMESADGEGTTVYISLPKSAAATG